MNGDPTRKGATKRVLRFSFTIPPVARVRVDPALPAHA